MQFNIEIPDAELNTIFAKGLSGALREKGQYGVAKELNAAIDKIVQSFVKSEDTTQLIAEIIIAEIAKQVPIVAAEEIRKITKRLFAEQLKNGTIISKIQDQLNFK
jgi:hypothetical protein